MRALVLRGLLASLCVSAASPCAWAEDPASGSRNAALVARAEALAHYIENNNLLLTDAARAARLQEVERMQGEARLQALYDIAVKFYIDGDAEQGAPALARLAAEAQAQHDARYVAMAGMIRAYIPARTGDIVAARRNLEAALANVRDP